MKYAEQRIPTLNEYCVVCDEQHVFQNGSMLKVRILLRSRMRFLSPPLLFSSWVSGEDRILSILFETLRNNCLSQKITLSTPIWKDEAM